MVDVPEMDYFACDGQGEICCKGPSVFIGYYKNEEKTRETIDEDGWLHTGDIGQWLPNGTMKIIDRKKNIFKLAQGEYVAAEKIETTYMRSQFIAQAFVEGTFYHTSTQLVRWFATCLDRHLLSLTNSILTAYLLVTRKLFFGTMEAFFLLFNMMLHVL